MEIDVHKNVVLVGLILALVLVSGCYPYIGRGGSWPNDPVPFTNKNSGEPVQELLVLHQYIGMLETKGRTFLAHPFIYHAGDPFTIYEPMKFGIYFTGPEGGSFISEGSTLQQLIVIAPGFKSNFIWYPPYHNRFPPYSNLDKEEYRLEPLEPQKAIEEIQMMADFLKKDMITSADQAFSGLQELDSVVCWNGNLPPIKVNFTSKERKMIESFLSAAIQRLMKNS